MGLGARRTIPLVVESTQKPCNPDTTFNEVRPPQMCTIDVLPPERSTVSVVGAFEIQGADFERVIDSDYPWQQYVGYENDPGAFAKMTGIKKLQTDEVDRDVVTRLRYWERQEPKQYAESESITVMIHTGSRPITGKRRT